MICEELMGIFTDYKFTESNQQIDLWSDFINSLPEGMVLEELSSYLNENSIINQSFVLDAVSESLRISKCNENISLDIRISTTHGARE